MTADAGRRRAPAVGRRILRAAVSIGLFFVAWQLVAWSGLVSTDYLPGPLDVVRALIEEMRRGDLPRALGVTFVRALAGLAAASLLAVAMALLTARYADARLTFDPIAEFLRPLPPAAIVPIAIFFLGLGWKLYAFILVTACFWPVYLSASQGLRGMPILQVEIARTFGYTPWRIVLDVRLPAALPTIFIGIRQASAIALIAAVATEMIAGRDGLGFYLMDSGMSLRIPETFAGLLMAMAAGLVINGIVVLLRRRIVRWHETMVQLAAAR